MGGIASTGVQGRVGGHPAADSGLGGALETVCRLIPAEAGAILRLVADRAEVLAVSPAVPPGQELPAWLERAVQVVAGSEGTERPVGESPADVRIYDLTEPRTRDGVYVAKRPCLACVRLAAAAPGVRTLAVFVVKMAAAGAAEQSSPLILRVRQIVPLVELLDARARAGERDRSAGRLGAAMETAAAVQALDHASGAAMGLCNEVAARWRCERVTLGFLRGRAVHALAMNNTEKLVRKMRLVQEIEAAMEESLDQDAEVIHHAPAGAAPGAAETEAVITRATRALAEAHGGECVCSLPLRRGGRVVGVLTLERTPGAAFAPTEVEALRVAVDLCTPWLDVLRERDRWFGARLADGVRRAAAKVVGAEHTWIKLATVAGFALILFLVLARGMYRVEAPFVLQTTRRQVIPAPFDGFLQEVAVEIGDQVEAARVLARLDDTDLRLRLSSSRAELLAHQKEAATKREENKTAEMQGALALADKTKAEIDLLEERLRQATLAAPIAGRVVTGDLKAMLGAPVKTGDVLFEVAPVEALRAEIAVPEDQIADVIAGQRGELAAASFPGDRIGFVVERIEPVSQLAGEQNVFKVRVQLDGVRDWMRPGMEGVAKVDVERRRYAWIWTRRLVNWVRMRVWV